MVLFDSNYIEEAPIWCKGDQQVEIDLRAGIAPRRGPKTRRVIAPCIRATRMLAETGRSKRVAT